MCFFYLKMFFPSIKYDFWQSCHFLAVLFYPLDMLAFIVGRHSGWSNTTLTEEHILNVRILFTLTLILLIVPGVVLAQEHTGDTHKKRHTEHEFEFEFGRSSRATKPPETEAGVYWLTNTKFGERKLGLGTFVQYLQVSGAINEGRFGVGPTYSRNDLHIGGFVGATTRGQAFAAAEVKVKRLQYVPEFTFGNGKDFVFHQRGWIRLYKNKWYVHGDSLRVIEEEHEGEHGKIHKKAEHVGRVGIEYRFQPHSLKNMEFFINPDVTTQGRFGIVGGIRFHVGDKEH